jgi:hypothetical protein
MAGALRIEVLKCPQCGNAGVAELSESNPFEGHEDFVPAGFKARFTKIGVDFYCAGCEVLAKSTSLGRPRPSEA